MSSHLFNEPRGLAAVEFAYMCRNQGVNAALPMVDHAKELAAVYYSPDPLWDGKTMCHRSSIVKGESSLFI